VAARIAEQTGDEAIAAALARFREDIPDAKDLRDVLEHPRSANCTWTSTRLPQQRSSHCARSGFLIGGQVALLLQAEARYGRRREPADV
jgi:hypothetical protein